MIEQIVMITIGFLLFPLVYNFYMKGHGKTRREKEEIIRKEHEEGKTIIGLWLEGFDDLMADPIPFIIAVFMTLGLAALCGLTASK